MNGECKSRSFCKNDFKQMFLSRMIYAIADIVVFVLGSIGLKHGQGRYRYNRKSAERAVAAACFELTFVAC